MNILLKKLPYLIALISVFATFYFFSSQRVSHSKDTEKDNLQTYATQLADSDKANVEKNRYITEGLIQDFENAFLKQYTPLLGCEDITDENMSATCSRHLAAAKNEFQQEFIQRRGLPKDTFTEQHLSATN